MITLEGSTLGFRYPEVHVHANTEVHFQRTLRIPDDRNHYPLPPGLGRFPLQHMEDLADRVPKDWATRGGVIMPLYQAEAMWIAFTQHPGSFPFAIKIAAGRVNAVSGEPWKPQLDAADDDYVVVPPQPWLDGFCVAKDVVRQFVAMPLGAGYSIEEQLTGKVEHGGLQFVVYPMKAARYEEIVRMRAEEARLAARKRAAALPRSVAMSCSSPEASSRGIKATRVACDVDAAAAWEPKASRAMSLAAGGRMTQQIYKDPYGLEAWD
jgi:hypothetical protein